MPRLLVFLVAGVLCSCAQMAHAQFGKSLDDSKGPQLGTESVLTYEIGIEVTAEGGLCKGIVATTPIPIDWPEQTVTIVGEEFDPFVKDVSYRMVGDTVKQMVVSIPSLPPGQKASAMLKVEIRRHSLNPPDDTSIYRLPTKLDRATKLFLGPSPKIESRHRKIKTVAKEATEGKEDAWGKVEAIYDWVREHVTYKNGKLKGALAALEDGDGDCEELTSLFIAMCRAEGIPARTVWVPSHCYPEFYLEDAEGKGHWFPCQAAGTRAFGGIPEERPILQKGDNFRVPGVKDKKRYVSEELTGSGGSPKVKFIRRPANAER